MSPCFRFLLSTYHYDIVDQLNIPLSIESKNHVEPFVVIPKALNDYQANGMVDLPITKSAAVIGFKSKGLSVCANNGRAFRQTSN